MTSPICFALLSCCALAEDPATQAVVTGRLRQPTAPQNDGTVPLGAIYVFGALAGPGKQPLAHRTWETEPAGWYRLAGPPGSYNLLFANPAQFMRPVVLTDVRAPAGQTKCDVQSHADYAVFAEKDWDRQPAQAYFQPFAARGRSVTQVGFKLATDGVDGFGPGSQDLEVSIHRVDSGPPEGWKQVGPAIAVLSVDCGGGKNRPWSAGWDSGEVPVQPGESYAVHLKARRPSGTFQAFWQPCSDPASCCTRQGGKGPSGPTARRLWMSVATDDDELVIPYNKRVHREYGQFAGFGRKWSQTYVAQGSSLAGVVVYAAVGGTQPPLSRQRVAIRVRRGGPAGPVVGVEKVAIGNGNYTGDASWGTFGTVLAPGEVPLVPGSTYAVEIETLETPETLRGFVNIKGQVSDERPGLNPYRKFPPDAYERGTAYRDGREPVDFDLDVQIIEFRAKGR
jgi:hypothetical protein